MNEMEEPNPKPAVPPDAEWRSPSEPINSLEWAVTSEPLNFPILKVVAYAGVTVILIVVLVFLVRKIAHL